MAYEHENKIITHKQDHNVPPVPSTTLCALTSSEKETYLPQRACLAFFEKLLCE
jgi:hypothetical protein